MLIDKRYFTGDLYIPNLTSSGAGVSEFVSKSNELVLNKLIVKHEKSFLEKVLGKEMASLFLTEIKKTPVEEKWNTLKCHIVDQENLLSPLANYVYYWYLRNQITETAGVGEVITQTNNAVIVSPVEKMVRAWNEMIDNVHDIVMHVNANKRDFTCFNPDYKSDVFFKINSMGL